MSQYLENERTAPVALCDARGRLNPAAKGWSRKPLHRCNLTGHWPRKKKWNYWCILDEHKLFSITLSSVDYIGLVFAYFIDFDTKEIVEKTIVTPFGAGCRFPEMVEKDIAFSHGAMPFTVRRSEGKVAIHAESRSFGKKKLIADITIAKPSNHETLNVVIPWSADLFQFTSKQCCMPASGAVTIGDKSYYFNAEEAFAVLDYGRGVWPYRTTWNWASCSARIGGDVVGFNLGGQWTDGTGANENGIFLNGTMHKISEDVLFTYDKNNFVNPWTIRTRHTNAVELRLEPIFEKKSGVNLLLLKSDGHQMFGHFSGTLKVGGREIRLDKAIGWAEEHVAKW